MGVLSFPFLFKDRAHANRVLEGSGHYTERSPRCSMPKASSAAAVLPRRRALHDPQPIHKLADFNGKKLRINGTDAERERFRRLGATSVAMNLADMLTALQNKTIDGSGSGTTIFVNFNLETVSKELLRIEDTLIISYCGMSKKWLDGCRPTCARSSSGKPARGCSRKATKAIGRVQRDPGQALGGQGRQVQPPLRRGAERVSAPARQRWRGHHRR